MLNGTYTISDTQQTKQTLPPTLPSLSSLSFFSCRSLSPPLALHASLLRSCFLVFVHSYALVSNKQTPSIIIPPPLPLLSLLSLFALLSPEQFCSLIGASSWYHLCLIWERMSGCPVGFGQTKFSWSCFLSAVFTQKKKRKKKELMLISYSAPSPRPPSRPFVIIPMFTNDLCCVVSS